MAKLFKVFVELYELLITARKDDRSGRVTSTGTLKIDDLIAIAVTRRSDINAVTMKASYEILKEVALEEVCGAKQVEFGLSHYGLGVEGIFVGDHAVWDSSKNSLILKSVATAEARNAVKSIVAEVCGMASSGTYINTLTDVVSGKIDSVITPGGAVNLTGVKIRIAGDAPGVGLYLTDTDGVVFTVPATSIAVNEPSKITFVVPPDLPAGDYKLSIVTQYSSSNGLLKEPRTCVFDYILACGA